MYSRNCSKQGLGSTPAKRSGLWAPTTGDGTRSSSMPVSTLVDTARAASVHGDVEQRCTLLVISTSVAVGDGVAAGPGGIPPPTPPFIDERASATASGTPTLRVDDAAILARGLVMALVRSLYQTAWGKRPSATGPAGGTATPVEDERNCVSRGPVLGRVVALREAPVGVVLELAPCTSMVAGSAWGFWGRVRRKPKWEAVASPAVEPRSSVGGLRPGPVPGGELGGLCCACTP